MTMYEKILAAQKRLAGKAKVTPVMSSSTLNELLGLEVYFKCENFQKVGAFKFRGAFNAMSMLSEVERKRGVIAYSSGNHAQAVSLAGRMLDVSVIIVMPSNAPAVKLAATRAYGATVVEYDATSENREEIAEAQVKKHGYSLIPPYNHEGVIAGQGTAALEFHSEIPNLKTLLVPCGGGGLLSGSAVATKSINPECKVIGVEPELADDATRSFYSKTLQTVHNPQTIADGARTPSLGSLTFPLVLAHVDEMYTVSEEDIVKAMGFVFYRMKLVVEPSAVLGLAALISGEHQVEGPVGIILSGGNCDVDTLSLIS